MWPFHKAKPRRREAHRHRKAGQTPLHRRVLARGVLLPLAITAAFFGATTAVILYGEGVPPYRIGERVQEAITARVDFHYEDAAETHKLREDAKADTYAHYVLNEALLSRVEAALAALLEDAKAEPDAAKLRAALAAQGWTLDEAATAALLSFAKEEKTAAFAAMTLSTRRKLSRQYVTARPDDVANRQTAELFLPDGTYVSLEKTVDLLYVSNEENVAQASRAAADGFPPALQPAVEGMIHRLMRPGEGKAPVPVYAYDVAKTQRAAEKAANLVQPQYRSWTKGQQLVQAGTVLTQQHLQDLQHEYGTYWKEVESDPALRREQRLSEAGIALLVLLVTIGMAVYTWIYQPRIVRNPVRALAAAALLLSMVAAARLTVLGAPPRELVVAYVVITASILSMAYTQRFALGIVAGLSVLITLAVTGMGEAGTELLIMLVAATAVTVVGLREVRRRTKLIEVGALAGIAAFVTAVGVGLIGKQDPRFVIGHASLAGCAALGAGFVVQGLLPLIENAFRITTSLALLEWCDANRPLLKRMAQEAPGTYNHSLVISSMAEAAAETIGQNGLLLRVGALYHDIGKMNKPDYFTENQEAQINRHDKLAPTMSLLIIVGHVKDGIEMAKEYGLPPVLHQFIAEHHGTTVVRYFHQMASEKKDKKITGRHDRQVPDTEFRYPGPKPQSKATAILMLCDAVEGATRAMSEPTAGRIESLVHQSIMDRLKDGQLDQCDITLRELGRVEDSLVKSLCRFYHSRIKYPQKSGDEQEGRRRGTA